jgi:hypothetical protein
MSDGETFRLSPDQRARLRSDIDVEALERLLGELPPHVRVQVMDAFVASADGPTAGFSGVAITGSPELEQLLEAVWSSSHTKTSADENTMRQSLRTQRAPVLVALVSQLASEHAVAAVWRRTAPEPRELIMLPEEGADGSSLAAAYRCLMQLRFQSSTPAGDEVTLVWRKASMENLAEPFRAWEVRQLEHLGAFLTSLRGRQPMVVPGVGEVHADLLMSPLAE